MSKMRKWFLPETPDVLGMLHEQFRVTREGMAALVRWAESGITMTTSTSAPRGDCGPRVLALIRAS